MQVYEKERQLHRDVAATVEDRLPDVDRAILRMAVFELLWVDDVPDAVGGQPGQLRAGGRGAVADDVQRQQGADRRRALATAAEGREVVLTEQQPGRPELTLFGSATRTGRRGRSTRIGS